MLLIVFNLKLILNYGVLVINFFVRDNKCVLENDDLSMRY